MKQFRVGIVGYGWAAQAITAAINAGPWGQVTKVCSSRALDAAIYSRMTDGHHFVPFDKVTRVMKQTGHDLPSIYKETAEGGLAIE